MIGNAPLRFITAEPFTDVEIDQHKDAARIWATIEKVRYDQDEQFDELITSIAKTINCSVDENGLICFDCEDDEIRFAMEMCENFINAFKIAKSMEN